ncbi:MAG: transcription termination factor Rho [Jatrophihabitantaceae bacterium]
MTDTQEQTLPAASESRPAAAAATNGGAGGPDPARARRGSLSTMLLPELQQLASGMGLPTAKVKKSDLVAAIQAARSANGSAGGAAAPERAGHSQQHAERSADPSAGERRTDGAGERRTEQPPRDRQQNERQQNDRQGAQSERQNARQNQGNQNQGSQNQANQNQGSQNQGSQNQGSQNQGSGNQSSQSQNSQNQNSQNQGGNQHQNRPQAAGEDDDFDGGRRRGRRYRDRRGRNRDRAGTPAGGGNLDVEPTVSEDDVLVPVAGILDAIEEKNTWFVRTEGYFASPEDVYVANSYVRRFGLRRGDAVTGAIRQQRDGERREKYNPLVRLDTVNGTDPEKSKARIEFTKLTPLYPQVRLRLETEPHILTTRVIDLVMPIGKGQRALIVSPPKAGKTMVLQAIANAIAVNNPEVHLMVVLIDERPEEVTDMQRSVRGEVIASTFDRRPQDHITVAELSIERAKRLVEMGHDVVVLLDSITRLGRAYNLGAPASGRILSGGVDSTALYPPKRFLGAARNIEHGGSLTIMATALVETGSAGDTVIFEEFKGTGNAELKLDRKIADKRVFPAVDVDQSSTRKEELLLSPDELSVTIKLRRVLHSLEQQQAIDLLLDRLKKSRTNLEFLMQIAKSTPGQE